MISPTGRWTTPATIDISAKALNLPRPARFDRVVIGAAPLDAER